MPIALTPDCEQEYILADEREKTEGATVFILRAIPGRKFSRLLSLVSAVDVNRSSSMTEDTISEVLKTGLKGWKNFKDQNGKDVEFAKDSDGYPKTESLDKLDWNTSVELVFAVVNYNTVSIQDKKK